MTQRGPNGRFLPGNTVAGAGGRARAAKLSKRRRRQIAKQGYRAMVNRHFGGDDRAQRAYLAELGRWAYEQQAAVDVGLGASVAMATRHPGPIQEFRARFYQMELFSPLNREVDFGWGVRS